MSMENFSCINCGARFANCESYRQHYKTDWHRYNLKRRVSQLPPVTAEEFDKRVLQIRNETELALAEQNTTFYCHACHKQFSNQKAHDNHLNSKKHKMNLIRYTEEHDGNTDEVLTKRRIPDARPHPALVAAAAGKGKYALAVQDDTTKMIVEHDMDDDDDDDDEYEDIAEEEIDSDEYDKIAMNPLSDADCLFCTHKSDNLVENLKHMSVAHSFFIPDAEYCTDIEGLLYYLGEKIANYYMCLWCNDRGKTFYSLDAVRKHMIDKGHCQMLHEGLALAEYADYYDYSSSYPDHQEGMDVDEEVIPDLLDGDDYQLVLPSGAVIGHRSLLRYYKQRLKPQNAVIPKKSDRKMHKVLSEYRALGWTQTQQQAAARKARDLHLMKRVQSKWQMKLGIKANKLQKHYRAQVLI